MKKIVALVLVVCAVCGCVPCYASNEFVSHIYPLCGVIVEVNFSNNYILIEDFVGNLWAMDLSDDWAVGDLVAMIMDDNGTDIIFDDIIIDIRYCGSLEWL